MFYSSIFVSARCVFKLNVKHKVLRFQLYSTVDVIVYTREAFEFLLAIPEYNFENLQRLSAQLMNQNKINKTEIIYSTVITQVRFTFLSKNTMEQILK